MGERVIVVGAGMVGLTCAVRLAEAGHRVDVLARDLPGETASSLAASPWLAPPTRLGADAARWARTTHEVLMTLAQAGGDPGGDTGVRLAPGRILPADASGPPPSRVELPVVVPMPYLRALTRRLRRAGGTLTRMSLPVLPTPARARVVNCTGVASRALVPDPLVVPRTRRVVHLADPGLASWTALVDGGGECRLLIVPDARGVMVSGDDAPADELVRRAAAVEPRLAGSPVVGERTAVRAERGRVRLGPDTGVADGSGSGPANRPARVGLVHSYGHGTAAMSLSWGCAQEVEALLGTAVSA